MNRKEKRSFSGKTRQRWSFVTFMFFLFLISCKGPYTPTDTESKIMDETFSNINIQSKLNFKNVSMDRNELWHRIDTESPGALKVGELTDEVFQFYVRTNQLFDSIQNTLGPQRKFEYATFAKLYDSVIALDSKLGEFDKRFAKDSLLIRCTKKMKRESKITKNATINDLYQERFYQQNQYLALMLLKADLLHYYAFIIHEFKESTGIISCHLVGECVNPTLLLSSSKKEGEIYFEPILYMFDDCRKNYFSLENYFLNGKRLNASKRKYCIEIPIMESTTGEKTFHVLSSVTFWEKEVQSTLTGSYVITN